MEVPRMSQYLGVLMLLLTSSTAYPQVERGCYIETEDGNLILGSDDFRWQLDLSNGVHAIFVENRLTGKRIDLGGGPECGLRFSAAQQRIELLGWKQAAGGNKASAPNEEHGFRIGFHQPEFDDSQWQNTDSPWVLSSGPGGTPRSPNPDGYNWYRVAFELPEATGESVSFGLGGCGIYDFGEQRFFVNGVLIGERRVEQAWTEPGLVTLNPDDSLYRTLRFGERNVLAVQAWSQFDCRPARLRHIDPNRHYETTRILLLGDQFVSIGTAFQDVVVTGARNVEVLVGTREAHHIQIALDTAPSLGELYLHYEWRADEPALRKWLAFKNTSDAEQLLLDVNLGDYRIDVPVTEGFRGLPIYLGDAVFASIAHPSGVTQGSEERARLRLFPGCYLQPGEVYTSKQAVWGMARVNEARKAFWDYIVSRSMRRKSVGIKTSLHYDALGAAWGRPHAWGRLDPPSEEVCLSIMDTMEELQSQFGLRFDYFWMDAGWWEYEKRFGLKVWNETTFPNGPRRIIERANELGVHFGLWLTGGCTVPPEVQDHWRSVLSHHLVDYGIEGVKHDGMQPRCFSHEHAEQRLHLPGKYSVEPIQDANIRIYAHARELCPHIWLFLYWGHDSPWWLLHGNTTFDTGLNMEMQTPSAYPTLYDRDTFMLMLDQAQQYRHDTPVVGRDSLGVWMTTGWAPLGYERWIENLVLDICRGTGVLHLWADLRRFSDEDVAVLSHIAKVFKAHPESFLNSQPIIGDPWKGEPYGYACSDGQHIFVVVNNPTWQDQQVSVRLDESLAVESDGEWNLYRHYPRPARLVTPHRSKWRFDESISWYLRPFEVLLLQLAPVREAPVLNEPLQEAQLRETPPLPPAQQLNLSFERAETSVIHVRGDIEPCPKNAVLALVFHASHRVVVLPGSTIGDREVGPSDYSLIPGIRSAPWRVVRIPVEASSASRRIELFLEASHPQHVKQSAFLIPEAP
jgi:hypothetical protein